MVNFYVNLMQSWSNPCDLVWKIFIWWMIMWIVNLVVVVANWHSLRGRIRTQREVERSHWINDIINCLELLFSGL